MTFDPASPSEKFGNWQGVGADPGRDTVTVCAPWTRMTREQALVHAAWLVAVADPEGERFPEILARISGGEGRW